MRRRHSPVALTNCRFVLRSRSHRGGIRKKRLIVTGIKNNGLRVYTAEVHALVGNVLETKNGNTWLIIGEIGAK